MSDIFVSYAKEDRARVQTLAQALKAKGWGVFWDRVVPLGGTWRDFIDAELTAARCLIVVWSRTSVRSHWVLEEAEVARQRGILLPVFVDDVPPPLGFQSLQGGDLSGWDGAAPDSRFDEVVAAIARIVGAPGVLEQAGNEGGVDEKKGVPQEQRSSVAKERPGIPESTHRSHAWVPGPGAESIPVDARVAPRGGAFPRTPAMLLWSCVAAFAIFSGFLVASGSSSDHQSGYMFLANTVILILGTALWHLGQVRASRVCIVAAAIQIVIMVSMLSLHIGDAIFVIFLNACIAAALLGIALINSRIERKGPPSNPSFNQDAPKHAP